MRVIDAKFVKSAANLSQCDDFTQSEIAFLGRSNVGKSSFINSLTNQKSLAKSSSTPGKTRLINFFEVFLMDENEDKSSIIFVDLPGFGYAKVSLKEQREWQKNLDHFIKNRPQIRVFIHLIDSRHFDTKIDNDIRDYLESFVRPDQQILNIYTKADKINQSAKSAILKFDPNAILVSNLKKSGLQKAFDLIIKGVFGGK